MNDPSPDVRSVVISGLIRYGGIEAVARAAILAGQPRDAQIRLSQA